MSDRTTEMMLAAWAEHRAEGKRAGIDHRHEWGSAPEWAHREAEEWVQRDQAWRMLVGVRLANDAIKKHKEALSE